MISFRVLAEPKVHARMSSFAFSESKQESILCDAIKLELKHVLQQGEGDILCLYSCLGPSAFLPAEFIRRSMHQVASPSPCEPCRILVSPCKLVSASPEFAIFSQANNLQGCGFGMLMCLDTFAMDWPLWCM